ncbi:uncharacterized protein LOC118450828 [Vespa mandarinia]|uniref:uncharacterized protein LOC118450828 n=1 Tax=Vespa mandarinia TaxID=7446 RepID=UPI0016194F1B|nr:uncharacterized protein LOC118450828 [Vespa mandarinia]
MIDCKLSFGAQIQQTANKSAKGVTSSSRLMANVTWPNASKCRLLMTAVKSVLLYGVKVWAGLLSKESYQDRMTQVQRRAALRIVFTYRTVSESAILTIDVVIPIALLAQESYAVHLRKTEIEKAVTCKEEKEKTFYVQMSWEHESRVRLIAILIKDVKKWTEGRHGETNYYLTHFPSEQGYFRAYLYKMERGRTQKCMY